MNVAKVGRHLLAQIGRGSRRRPAHVGRPLPQPADDLVLGDQQPVESRDEPTHADHSLEHELPVEVVEVELGSSLGLSSQLPCLSLSRVEGEDDEGSGDERVEGQDRPPDKNEVSLFDLEPVRLALDPGR